MQSAISYYKYELWWQHSLIFLLEKTLKAAVFCVTQITRHIITKLLVLGTTSQIILENLAYSSGMHYK